MEVVLNQVMSASIVKPVINANTKLEVVCRITADKRYYFIINLADKTLTLPQSFVNKVDILTGNILTEQTTLGLYDVVLLSEKI
jgi:hypothetical protein